mgnify:CR=1 FL=1
MLAALALLLALALGSLGLRCRRLGRLIAGTAGGWILWEWAPRLAPRSPLPVLACLAIAGALFAGCLVVAQPL